MDLQIGDIVGMDGDARRWVCMGLVASPTGARTWGLITKSGDQGYTSRHRAEAGLDLVERPVFQIGETVRAVGQLGNLVECTIAEFREDGNVVRVLQPATDRPVDKASQDSGSPPRTPAPAAELENIRIGVEAGYSDVPLGMIVARNRL